MLKLRFKNNKHNAVWLVEPKVTIGRAAANDLVVNDPAVADVHAEILVKHETLHIVNISGGKPLSVNNKPVTEKIALSVNDEVCLGSAVLEVIDPKMESAAPKPAAQPTVTGWALKANSTALANRVYPVKNLTVVGRSNECDITLAAAHLSRRHAELSLRDGVLYVKDLGSANGTYLNNERITEARVKRGDDLRFDTLSFGVIGPAQDLDKTTVRAAPIAANLIPHNKPANKAEGASDVIEKPRAAPVSTPARAPVRASTPASHSTAGAASESGSKLGLIVITVVAVVAIAAGIAYQHGLLNF